MCPYPQTALYQGGDPKVAASWRCGGNIETNENVCMDLVARYQRETRDDLDTRGLDDRKMCSPRHRDDDDDNDDD
jgi:hypothetical protein